MGVLSAAQNHRRKEDGSLRYKGSLTVESAFVLPLFFFLITILTCALDLYRISTLIQTSLCEGAKELGMYAYCTEEDSSSPRLITFTITTVPAIFSVFSLSASSTAAWIPTYSSAWIPAVISTVFPGGGNTDGHGSSTCQSCKKSSQNNLFGLVFHRQSLLFFLVFYTIKENWLY